MSPGPKKSPARLLFDELLPRWVRDDPDATAVTYWHRALEERLPLPARRTFERWVTKARKSVGVGGVLRPIRPTGNGLCRWGCNGVDRLATSAAGYCRSA